MLKSKLLSSPTYRFKKNISFVKKFLKMQNKKKKKFVLTEFELISSMKMFKYYI